MSHRASASARPRNIVALFLTSLTILVVFPVTAEARHSFGSAVAYDAGAPCLNAIAVADVNADGRPDVLTAGGCSDIGSVSVFLGNGDGSFQPAMVYDSGGVETTSLQVADVNGDGKPDVLAASVCSTADCLLPVVAVLLGNGDGTFQSPVTYDSGLQPWSLADGDVNGDGKLDLVVAGEYVHGRPASLIGVLLGNGDGTFQSVATYGSGPDESVVLSDVNNDGRLDAVVTILCSDAYCKNGLLGVLLGNGDGTFEPALTYDVGYQPIALAVADVNGDGKADALVTKQLNPSSLHSGVGVLLGNGDGTFGPVMTYDSGALGAMFLAVGDLNLDGQPDVVVANCMRGRKNGSGCTGPTGIISVLQGNGDGTFRAPVLYKSGGVWARSVAVADVNADGRPDLLVANTSGGPNGDGTLGVLLNILVVKTTTVLSGSPNPAQVNESVTFTATITSDLPVPDGELITFYSGGAKLGTGTTKNGTATLTTSFSRAKTYGIKASFAGDRYYKASSAWVKEVVNP